MSCHTIHGCGMESKLDRSKATSAIFAAVSFPWTVGDCCPSPLAKQISDGTVDMADYEGQPWPKVPVAIPSKGRESELWRRTLKTWRIYQYDMSKVQVFVDATPQREDGSN